MSPATLAGVNDMHAPRLLLVPLLLALPIASAGGYDASVDYFEPGEGGCRASSASDGGSHNNGTWGWSWYESRDAASCADSFSYADASVRDEDGDLARVHAGTRESSADNGTSTYRGSYDRWDGWESSQWSYETSRHNATADGRSAGVETREGSLGADTGCRATDSWRSRSASSSYSYGDDGGWTDWQESGSASWRRCATSVTLAREGESATLTPWSDECRSTYESDRERSRYEWGSQNQSYEGAYDNDASSQECASGVSASTGEGAASAGQESRCSSVSSRSSSTRGNDSFAHSYASSGCVGGFAVRGPDGMVLFVGGEDETWESCTEDDGVRECHGGQDQRRYVRLAWAHSPLGPHPTTVSLP